MSIIKKIVITGGPCGGKSEALKSIRRYFGEKGWRVLVVPETPTELISGGVSPWTCYSPFVYQLLQMRLHQKQEEIFMDAAQGMTKVTSDNILIVCDRGQFDCLAYMDEKEFELALYDINEDKDELLNSYDAIFHLECVAKKFPEYYTLDTNQTRIEDAQTACKLDDKTYYAWIGHPNHFRIEGEEDFNLKIHNLLFCINRFLSND